MRDVLGEKKKKKNSRCHWQCVPLISEVSVRCAGPASQGLAQVLACIVLNALGF